MPPRHVRRVSAVVLSTALLFGLAGLSIATGSASAASTATKSDTIIIKNFMYSPMKLKVVPGAEIKVTNKDSVTHTLTATNGKFNTGNIKPGKSKSFKAPMKAGTYHYICSIHQFMKGTITVK